MINKTIKWRIFTHIINIHNSTITNEHGSNSIASHQLLLNLHFSQASSTSTQSVHVLTVTQSVFIPTPFKISIWFPNCHRIYKMHTIPNCSSLSEKARRLLHYPRTNEKVWLPLSEVVETRCALRWIQHLQAITGTPPTAEIHFIMRILHKMIFAKCVILTVIIKKHVGELRKPIPAPSPPAKRDMV